MKISSSSQVFFKSPNVSAENFGATIGPKLEYIAWRQAKAWNRTKNVQPELFPVPQLIPDSDTDAETIWSPIFKIEVFHPYEFFLKFLFYTNCKQTLQFTLSSTKTMKNVNSFLFPTLFDSIFCYDLL